MLEPANYDRCDESDRRKETLGIKNEDGCICDRPRKCLALLWSFRSHTSIIKDRAGQITIE